MFSVYVPSTLLLVMAAALNGFAYHAIAFSHSFPIKTERSAIRQRAFSVATTPSSAEGISSDQKEKGKSSQQEYGKSLPLPSTYARCASCQAHFALRPEDLGETGKGRQVQCSLCNHAWFQTRDRLFEIKDGFELVPFDQHQVDLIAGNLKAGRKAGYGGAAKLYVGNLAFGVEEADLVEFFGKIGDVGEVIIVKNPETGRSRGFAFVTMMTKEDGEKAVSDLDGTDLMGRALQVREPNNENAPRGSRD